VFGCGAVAHLREELDRLELHRVLVVCTPGRATDAGRIAELLGSQLAAVFPDAREHVPEDVVVAARRAAERTGADTVLAFGGGSAIGVAKATALGADVCVVAVPTTYSGSEMTPIWGITQGGEKRTGTDTRVRPALVVYDPELTTKLPAQASAASGFNALAHCVEALYAAQADPLAQLAAEHGAHCLGESLPRIVANPLDLEARQSALLGAYLAGVSLSAGLGLHHKLCHVLGGAFGLPHAETHAVLLGHVVAFNAEAAPAAMQRLANALDAPSATEGVVGLLAQTRLADSLAALGLAASDVARAAELATARPIENPRPVGREDIEALLLRALSGPPSRPWI
jgi:maleylacetate reductase